MIDRFSLLWSSLNILTKVRYDALMEVYGSLEEATKHLGEDLLRSLGCRQETVLRALLQLEEFDAAIYERQLKDAGISFMAIQDQFYPRQLRDIPDPPMFLYYRGDPSVLEQPTIGLVGTRKMSSYGKRVVESFVPDFVHAGMVTVSGLAEGIDATVASETLKAGGKTVAVLGHGLGMIFPKSNAELAEEIVESGGLLLSEFPLHFRPDTYTFPSRNRIIAGLSLGTVVLEAPEGSGAIITAELALEYGRDVFAVPGQIFDPKYAGCHAIIAKGQAKLVTHATDVLQEIGVIAPTANAASAYEPRNDEEGKILSALSTMPQPIDDLVEKSGLEAGRIGATLTMMELSGAVKNVGNGMWVRN